METRKLYYDNCMLREFSARVECCEKVENGWEVILDATAFYPEGGGQACDLGILGGATVLDVREKGKTVIHLCSAPLTVGETVTGCIDWERRFDLMQQHTGEHILSGLIHKKFGYHNTGFHVGKGVMEVDFGGSITWDALMELEAAANRAVWEDIPLRCWYPGREELSQVFYRTKRQLDWPVRIVQIPGYDSCACCGVHVERTGQVGLIKILSCTKFHQGVRLEMVCGQRAYAYMSRVFEENRQVSQAFSAQITETGAAAKRMNEMLAAEKLRSGNLEKQVFGYIAGSYVNHKNVVHFQPGLNSAAVRDLADAMADKISGIAAVFSGADSNYLLCLASRTADVKTLGIGLTQALNGRGGGKAGFFQGSVRAARAEIEDFLSDIM